MEVNVIRTEPVTVKPMSVPAEPADITELREIYRNKAELYIGKLKRSVCKNYEIPPSYEGYQDEIRLQRDLAEQIFFIQNCRAAAELAQQEGKAVVEGKYMTVTFTKQDNGKILVTKIGR